MKTLFFNQPFGLVTEENGTSNYSSLGDAVMPYSLLCAAGLFQKHAAEVEFYDAQLEKAGEDEIIKHVQDVAPGLIVTTVGLAGICRSRELLGRIKKSVNARILVLFTEHFENEFAEYFPYADFIVLRNWAEAAFTVSKELSDGKSAASVPGVYSRQGATFAYGGERERRLPQDAALPGLELVSARRYQHQQVLLSEGCNYSCGFCHFGNMLHSGWHGKSVDRCIEELRLLRNCGKRFIRIMDNELAPDISYAKALMRRIISEKLDIAWEINLRACNTDEELVGLLAQAGCVQAGFGAESGVQEILDLNNKQLRLEQIVQLSRWLDKYNIASRSYFLVGLRGDTEETIKRTFDFVVNEVKADTSSFDIVVPYPGTPYHGYLKSAGLLDSVSVVNLLWIYRNCHGFSFIPEKETVKPQWRYENFTFDALAEIAAGYSRRIPRSNQSAKLKKLLLRGPDYAFFALNQSLSNPAGSLKRLREFFK